MAETKMCGICMGRGKIRDRFNSKTGQLEDRPCGACGGSGRVKQ